VNRARVSKRSAEQENRLDVNSSKLFVFCDKSSGIAQFRAESNVDLDYTVERVGGLFAMQCLVRGHDPDDFLVLVPADATVVGRLVSRAKEILEEGRVLAGPAPLSPRQSEILRSVICNRANKEIASKLNITVRTVKFHISSLLNKFGVDNRADLARRAAGLIRPAPPEDEEPLIEDSSAEPRPRPLNNASLDAPVRAKQGADHTVTRSYPRFSKQPMSAASRSPAPSDSVSITSRSIAGVPIVATVFARKSSTSHVHRSRHPHGRFRASDQLQSGRRQPLNIAEEDHDLPDLLVG
jgi:DNA-binding CsgD family transcriptional regulator